MSASPIEKACQYLITHANYQDGKPKSKGLCAKSVRTAVDFGFYEEVAAGKKRLTIIGNAKNSGKSYEDFGFKNILTYPCFDKDTYKPLIGDICIIQYEPYGHICMFTKDGWYSDFKQIDRYGGSIRKQDPQFSIYRYAST